MGLLERVSRGKVAGPVRLVVYGPPSVGKSTFAAGAPSPLFIDCERRTRHLDVARIEPSSWEDVLGTMREVHAAPGEYKTLVVDTLDHMELLLHAHVCKANGWQTIEDPGYGKGFVPALHEWTRFMTGCEALQNKGLNVLLLAHDTVTTVKPPVGDDYNKHTINLKGGQKTSASDLIRHRVDLIGFAHFEVFSKKANAKDQLSKAKAITTGERVLTFAFHPAYETKCGVPMADEVKLSWDAFESALKENNK